MTLIAAVYHSPSCGGTGSAVVAGLPYLHQSLAARGHPGGLHVTVMDGDTISPANCVRQPFARSEIGLNKAIVLTNRLNMFWGLKWEAIPVHLKAGTFISRNYSGDDLRAHIVGGCVDTRAARATIRAAGSNLSTVSHWLDLGNNSDSGQFILGEPLNQRNPRARLRLRSAAELFPEIVDPNLDNDGEPSCSAAAALERQEPFINSTLAQHALALLARVFCYGQINYHGGFVNLATGATSMLRLDQRYESQFKAIRGFLWLAVGLLLVAAATEGTIYIVVHLLSTCEPDGSEDISPIAGRSKAPSNRKCKRL